MNARYEHHPENGDWPHVCVWDLPLGVDCWVAYRTREQAEARVAEMKAGTA